MFKQSMLRTHSALLVGVVLVLACIPLTAGHFWAPNFLIVLTCVLAVWAGHIRGEEKFRKPLDVGAAIVLFISIVSWFGHPTVKVVAEVSSALLVLVVSLMLVFRIMKDTVVNLDTVVAALCVYVLIGLGFAFLYQAQLLADPSAWGGSLKDLTRSDMTYYSYETLTTLGYGDILPVGGFSRSLAVGEAMVGQIFLVTLVARLVSTIGMQQRPPETSSSNKPEPDQTEGPPSD